MILVFKNHKISNQNKISITWDPITWGTRCWGINREGRTNGGGGPGVMGGFLLLGGLVATFFV
jgi:hypothetical protein